MRYHGIWDLNEIYDLQRDPDEMRNLIGDTRVTTGAGSNLQYIQDPDLRQLASGFNERITQILGEIGGEIDPDWLA
jgi:hypothetical protein